MAQTIKSKYMLTLDDVRLSRYLEKITCVRKDPYMLNLKECSMNIKDYPHISYGDIYNYVVHEISAYTYTEMKAYKGLEAYKQAACGWVKNIYTKKCSQKVIIIGQVLHSQRLNEKPLSCWLITENDGKILYSHCDCIAGLGERCTHVCAVLFFIDMCLRSVDTNSATSVTDVKACWKAPSTIAGPNKLKLVDVNFTNAAKVMEHMYTDEDLPLYSRENDKNQSICSATNEEVLNMLRKLKETPKGCVLHLTTKPFSQETIKSKESFSLSNLYRIEYEMETIENLQKIGNEMDLSVPIDVCRNIEALTVKQSKSKEWFNYRAGRITASRFKAACRTDIENPSISLIKSICYPSSYQFKTAATIYGCSHEKLAYRTYSNDMTRSHNNFGGSTVGLCLNPKYPYFGASPDALIECDCCGMGFVEIKCPYCAKDIGLAESHVLKKVRLKEIEGKKMLDHNHTYYYQIQMQLAITGLPYCDFIVWSKHERIVFDKEFWEKESKVAIKFYKTVILPELLGKYFTNKIIEKAVNDTETSSEWDLIIVHDEKELNN